ncbi:hypothetical protein L596_023278 [Steinernema carpocapsae]|uniref:Uncharacterized protein n=1 Tax=Steinernema carpocapsae TaxID=34508 RepID=A0A4U5MD80_STECR|nr:hypothetical protein L596_023278 [Steinernema carpocapsae]
MYPEQKDKRTNPGQTFLTIERENVARGYVTIVRSLFLCATRKMTKSIFDNQNLLSGSKTLLSKARYFEETHFDPTCSVQTYNYDKRSKEQSLRKPKPLLKSNSDHLSNRNKQRL